MDDRVYTLNKNHENTAYSLQELKELVDKLAQIDVKTDLGKKNSDDVFYRNKNK